MNTIKNNIKYYLQAGFSGLQIKSVEEARVKQIIREIAEELVASDLNYDLYQFDIHSGLVNLLEEGGNGVSDPVEAMHMASSMDGRAITMFSDFHIFMEEGGAHFGLEVKRALTIAKIKGNHLIFIGCRSVIPPELEHAITCIEMELPDFDELKAVLEQTAKDAGLELPGNQHQVISALRGLTMEGASDALAYSLIKNGRFDPQDIALEKAKQINNSGLMEVISGEGTLDDIGGLDEAKRWVLSKTKMFDPESKSHGAKPPKGVLNIGVPGSGKTMFSRILANVYGLPILRLNMGALYNSLVGATEENIRMVLQTAKAMAPVILEIDEIDKGLGASMGAQSGDSGTTQRVIQTFLTWASEDHEGVFLIATANDPKKMKDSGGALQRKGRFDEIFFFDFPNETEREQIIKIHINKLSRLNPECPKSPIGSADDLDISSLVDLSDNYTGAEIEAAIGATFTNAFNEGRDKLELLDFETEFLTVRPLSETQSESIQAIRTWGLNHCRPASTPRPRTYSTKSRKLHLN